MKIEHVAYPMPDPMAAAPWYAEHLGFRVARAIDRSPYTHFLLDPDTGAMIEIYNNPAVAVPDYASMDPLLLHLAFAVDDVAAVRRALLAAGATSVGEITVTPDGDELAMLRDPWGFAIQLARRGTPMT